MKSEYSQKIKAQPPIKEENITIETPKEVAAGLPGVIASAKHIFGEMQVTGGLKTLFKVNQFNGFDCPGCAWPDPDHHRSRLGEYCENGAKAIAEEATAKRVNPDFFAKYTVAELSNYSDYWIGKQGRLTHPMILKPGERHYKKISWVEAFKLIGKQLNELASPNEAIFYTSGRTSNEAAFLYQLFVRQYGTNNLPDCSNMCHESSGVALGETLGIGKGSVKLEDFYQTDLILILGQNPGTNHPRMLSALKIAKEKGAKIITINPLPEAGLMRFINPQQISSMASSGTALTDLFLQVKINEDIALLKAIMKLMLDEEEQNGGVFDHAFINQNTVGYQELIADLKTQSVADLAAQAGISLIQVTEAAQMIMEAKTMISCWAMGITQHKNGVNNIREIVNMLLLKGSIGKPGAGTCPVRGHSNVQGDRTMGIWEKPKPAFLDKLQSTFNFEPPRANGYNTVEAMEAMYEGKAKVFFAMGGNFLSATPDTEYTAKALQNCELTVQVSTKLNRSHLVHGKTALILPCLGRTELDMQASGKQFVTVENSMGVVHQSRGGLKPASPFLLSEPKIVAQLAKATLGKNSKTDWNKLVDNYDNTRDAIEKVIPGFENYNKRVRKKGGFYLPNCARDGDFKTASGKAQFSVNAISQHQLQADQYLMMTIRSHDQFNTTIYGLDDRYRGIFNGRRIVLINPDDMEAARLVQGDFVDLVSTYDGVERIAQYFMVVPYNIPQQCIATYFPEANVLIPYNQFADRSHTPISKSVVVRVRLVD